MCYTIAGTDKNIFSNQFSTFPSSFTHKMRIKTNENSICDIKSMHTGCILKQTYKKLLNYVILKDIIASLLTE